MIKILLGDAYVFDFQVRYRPKASAALAIPPTRTDLTVSFVDSPVIPAVNPPPAALVTGTLTEDVSVPGDYNGSFTAAALIAGLAQRLSDKPVAVVWLLVLGVDLAYLEEAHISWPSG